MNDRFANTNYTLAMALRLNPGIKWIDHSYDINCQYERNVGKRFDKHFSDLSDVVRNIRYWIPQLHIHGHNDDCQYQYSLSFAEGVGQTHGEGIETCWAEQNQTGGMVKEMNKGHGHDTLVDFSGDWNWLKIQQMGTFPNNRHWSYTE